MKTLLTGSSGFIGNTLYKILNPTYHIGSLTENPISPPLSYSFHDIEIPSIDILIHQAAITNTTHKPESDYFLVNLEYPKLLFQNALKSGCKRFLYASSCAVYNGNASFKETDIPRPLNAYGKSKALFDEWAIPWGIENNVSVIGLRYSNVYGENEKHKGKSASMIYQLIQQMKIGSPRLYFNGNQERDWISIKDVINANLLASKVDGCHIFNIGSGIATSFNEVVKIINEINGTNYEPEWIENKYPEEYQNFTCCNLEKSNKILNYYPKINIKEGINNLIIYLSK